MTGPQARERRQRLRRNAGIGVLLLIWLVVMAYGLSRL